MQTFTVNEFKEKAKLVWIVKTELFRIGEGCHGYLDKHGKPVSVRTVEGVARITSISNRLLEDGSKVIVKYWENYSHDFGDNAKYASESDTFTSYKNPRYKGWTIIGDFEVYGDYETFLDGEIKHYRLNDERIGALLPRGCSKPNYVGVMQL